jgi:hypothetical protein
MSTERSLAVERALAVVRFAFSQVVRKGWSKQNCTSYFILHGFRFALHHITASGEEDDQPNLLIYLIDPITDPNIVRTQITEGPNSIIKNLPLPDVQPSTGTDDHSDVMGKLRSEIKQLEEPRKRYCGIVSYSERSLAVERALAEDQPDLLSDVVPTVVVTSAMLAIQNDHPERSKNTMTTQNGTYTRRWGHSTEFDAPNPNEAPVYNENDSNGDSDDDSLPELS